MPTLGLVASIVAIAAGVIIAIWPHIVSYIIAIFLVFIGIVGIINYFQ
jgi:hypothetical protein